LQRNRSVLQKIFNHNVCNNNDFTAQTVSENLLNATAILVYDTLQTTFPLSDAVVNETLRHCAALQQDRLLHLINSVELPAIVDSLLHGPKRRNPPDLNSGCWGQMSASIQATFSRCRYTIELMQCAMAHRPAAEFIRGAL